jgi:3-hydroxymyristoyl/3-hydroxydecanoyl-(acyl carrier protein) dehydratase
MTMRDSITVARKVGPLPQPDGTQAFEFNFSAEDPTFAGHFPDRPLLPGVFQLEIIRMAAEWSLNCGLSVQEVVRGKFQRPVLPGETLRMSLRYSEADGLVSARGQFMCGGQPAGEALLKLCRNE